MLRFFNKRIHNKKGFTLIELIVVIAILAILALIAIPRFSGFSETAKISADEQMAAVVAEAAIVYAAANNGTVPTMADLFNANYIEKQYTAADLQSNRYKAGTPAFTITAGTAPVTVVVTIGGTNTKTFSK